MARGLHDWKGTPIHVSAGVGIERGYAPQVRFLCRPEVCLLRARGYSMGLPDVSRSIASTRPCASGGIGWPDLSRRVLGSMPLP